LGGNYEKQMFNQLEKALLRIDQLENKVSKIEDETANKYLKIIYEKDFEIANQKEENTTLSERVVKLEEEVERLRKQLNNNSSNSSMPPSKDTKPNAPNTYNGRTKTGKKSGGQKGHKGYWLNKNEIEEKIQKGEIEHHIVNHGNCSDKYTSKYVLDMRIVTIATEHRFYEDDNGEISIPIEFRPDVQYGNNLKTFSTTLIGYGIVASDRVVEIIKALSDNLLRPSEGSLYNFLVEFNHKAAGKIETIKTNLLNGPVMHIDETGSRCENHNMYFRNYSNDKSVLYTVNPTKGKKAIENDDILTRYIGKLIHDHDTANYSYGSGNGECNVHIIRYLVANSDNTHNNWSNDMIDLLLSIKQSKEIAIRFGINAFEQPDIDDYIRRYNKIVDDGYEINQNNKSRFYKKEEKRLLNRLKKYRDNHLLFAIDFDVPFDNNLSERDLRIVKTKTKMSGGFRNIIGAKTFANIMSITKTAIKQKLSPCRSIQSVFEG